MVQKGKRKLDNVSNQSMRPPKKAHLDYSNMGASESKTNVGDLVANKEDIKSAKQKRSNERDNMLYKDFGGTDLAKETVAVETGNSNLDGGKDYEIMLEKATTIEEINEATRLKREAKIRHAAMRVDDDDEDESDYKVKDKAQKANDRLDRKVVKVFGEDTSNTDTKRVIDEDGTEYEKFNLDEERALGRYDAATGVFVWNRDSKEDGVPDGWLDSLGDDDGALYSGKIKNDDDDANEIEVEIDRTGCRKTMLKYMEPAETVMEALARLGKQKAKATKKEVKLQYGQKKKKPKQKKAMAWEEVEKVTPGIVLESETPSYEPKAIEELTSAAATLMNDGHVNVYDDTYEHLLRAVRSASEKDSSYRQERKSYFGNSFTTTEAAATSTTTSTTTSTEQSDVIPTDNFKWEYKWNNEVSAEVFGPYTTLEMIGWCSAGYFDSNLLVRKIEDTTSTAGTTTTTTPPSTVLMDATSMQDDLNDLDDDDEDEIPTDNVALIPWKEVTTYEQFVGTHDKLRK